MSFRPSPLQPQLYYPPSSEARRLIRLAPWLVSPPDGKPGPLALNQSLFTKLNFDPGAFVPVAVMGALPNVLVANAHAPFRTAPEFIAYAKANPGKLNFGSAGVGSTPHLLMAWLMNATGAQLTHVPYAGSAPALNDLLAGHIDVMFDNLGNPLQLIRDGKVRALGVGAPSRLPEFPDVPGLSESVPGFVASTWFAIVAPPKTPSDIAAKLSSAIAEIIAVPEVRARFEALAASPIGGTPEETAAFIRKERELWTKIVADAGIAAQ